MGRRGERTVREGTIVCPFEDVSPDGEYIWELDAGRREMKGRRREERDAGVPELVTTGETEADPSAEDGALQGRQQIVLYHTRLNTRHHTYI